MVSHWVLGKNWGDFSALCHVPTPGVSEHVRVCSCLCFKKTLLYLFVFFPQTLQTNKKEICINILKKKL